MQREIDAKTLASAREISERARVRIEDINELIAISLKAIKSQARGLQLRLNRRLLTGALRLRLRRAHRAAKSER